MMSDSYKGSCLCGAVEYEVREPVGMGVCHCTRCQRWTGSSLAGVVVNKENFTVTKGQDATSVAIAAPVFTTTSVSSTSWPPA
jgi:hypothetical protein